MFIEQDSPKFIYVVDANVKMIHLNGVEEVAELILYSTEHKLDIIKNRYGNKEVKISPKILKLLLDKIKNNESMTFSDFAELVLKGIK